MRPHRLGSNFDPRCRLRRVDAADARVSEVESQGPEDVVDAALVYDRKALMAEVEEPHRSRSRFGGAAGCTDGFNLEEARCKACGRCGPLEIGDEGCHLSNCSIQLSCGNETEQIWFEPLLPCDQEEESCHSASLGSAPVEYCLRRQQSECICMFVRVSARPAGSIGPADRLPGTALAAALGGLGHRGGWLAFGLALVESSGDVGGLTCSVGYAFVKAPPIRSVEDGRPLQLRGSTPTVSNASTAKRRSHFSTWQVATGLGLVASAKVARASTEVDWTGSATGWGRIRQKSILDVDWLNIHGVMTLSAVVLFVAQISRILAHQKPTELEVWLTAMVYLPWIYFCWRDSEQLENHYAVTFYASCGWAVMSLSSLFSVLYQDKYPDFAFGVLLFGNAIFAVACLYFYSYHWTRMWRHFTQNRFRPLWIPGLLGLMCLHLLTPLDLMKRLDDPGWWKTVCQVYNDEPVGPERRSHRCCVCVTIDHFPKQSLGGTALSVGLFLRMMVNVPFPKR
eukprot:g22960.t1